MLAGSKHMKFAANIKHIIKKSENLLFRIEYPRDEVKTV
jgi:hypothetical protein